MAARETLLSVHLTPFETQLAIALAVLAVVLVLHFILDVFVLRRLRKRRQAEAHERHLAAAAELSLALTRAPGEREMGRILLDSLNELIGNDFSGLVLVDESGAEGRGLVGRSGGADIEWYPSLRVDLRGEVSGFRRVFETRAPLVVENALSSPDMNPDLLKKSGVKSVFLIPLEGEDRILGVVTSGSTAARHFSNEQLTLAKMLVAEGALAFERAASSEALERALERERLVSEISRRARSETDVDRLIEIGLAETGNALGVDRTLLRLGDPTSAAPLRGQWQREGVDPVQASTTPFLAVSNLALRASRTIAIENVDEAEELADESLGGRAALSGIGSRAVLSTPIILFGSTVGALAAHASAVRRWSEDDVKFIEAIAREFGIALHTAGLLEEIQQRLEQQEKLLVATEVMAAELELDSVLSNRLAGGRAALVGALNTEDVMAETARQATELLNADASLLLELAGGELVASTSDGKGLEGLAGQRFPLAISLAGDVLSSRRPFVVDDLPSGEGSPEALDPVTVRGFSALLAVPIIGISDTRMGVLLVYSRKARVWSEKETDALVSLAAGTAAALGNASLYLRVSLEREQSVAILSSVADGIVAVDRRGRIVLWNAAAERMTGVASSDALGRTTMEVLRQDLGSGEPGERSIAIKRGRRELWLLVTESVMRDPADEIAGRIYALRDVSSDRVIEQAKSIFVSSVSHELRAPLTSIYGFAETMLRRGDLFDEAQRQTFLAYIASESERLTGIVDTLLDVAELDTGDLEVELAETDVARVVKEAVEGARISESGSGAGNGHVFVVDLPESEPLRAEVDREKLRRVLANLIDNAIKFSPAGGKVTVTGRKRHAGVVELRVEDEGVGIREEEREHIFRKFYRGYSSALSGGTGLGLFISRGLIQAMGGRIWVDSKEGSGSRFVLELGGAGNGEAER